MMPSDMVKREIEHLNEDLERVIQNHQFMLNMETKRIYERIEELQSECEHNFVDGVCEFCGLTAPTNEEPIEEETPEDEGAQEGEEE